MEKKTRKQNAEALAAVSFQIGSSSRWVTLLCSVQHLLNFSLLCNAVCKALDLREKGFQRLKRERSNSAAASASKFRSVLQTPKIGHSAQ